MWVGSVGGASVYEFEILSYIHSTIKPLGLAGKQQPTIYFKYPYHIPTKKSIVFYK